MTEDKIVGWSFLKSQLFESGGQSIKASPYVSVLPMRIFRSIGHKFFGGMCHMIFRIKFRI